MSSPVTVNILGKEYQIACPEEEKEALIASARMVHENMEKIRQSGKVVGVDRIAVMAALNIAHELIQIQHDESHDLEKVNNKILQLKERVSAFLDEDRQLEL
ncbi:MAG: cell division protein ZapA [Methylophaga sp.]|jgi:cell division protein ZapA|nr:cell division protein ZapA [Methylophaga sp.]MEC9314424.1 cell division protein ZapA [Pseudomonadota bacterium]MED5509766.1 cell division protein ZapA [Pseudomonadota bacterium]